MARKSTTSAAPSTATIGFEAKLWLTADKLRNNMDAAEPSGDSRRQMPAPSRSQPVPGSETAANPAGVGGSGGGGRGVCDASLIAMTPGGVRAADFRIRLGAVPRAGMAGAVGPEAARVFTRRFAKSPPSGPGRTGGGEGDVVRPILESLPRFQRTFRFGKAGFKVQKTFEKGYSYRAADGRGGAGPGGGGRRDGNGARLLSRRLQVSLMSCMDRATHGCPG